MTAEEFTVLWNAGGPVLVGLAAVISTVLYDRKRPRKDDNGDSIADVLEAVADTNRKIDRMQNEMTDRLARVETDLKNHQREIDKIDRR